MNSIYFLFLVSSKNESGDLMWSIEPVQLFKLCSTFGAMMMVLLLSYAQQ